MFTLFGDKRRRCPGRLCSLTPVLCRPCDVTPCRGKLSPGPRKHFQRSWKAGRDRRHVSRCSSPPWSHRMWLLDQKPHLPGLWVPRISKCTGYHGSGRTEVDLQLLCDLAPRVSDRWTTKPRTWSAARVHFQDRAQSCVPASAETVSVAVRCIEWRLLHCQVQL